MARALRADKVGVLETDTIRLSVKRTDVEASRMNNGRYLTLMDLGRIALTVRAGFLPILVKRRWFPLVTGVMIRFHRSLRIGGHFELSTRVVCWDARSFFLEQWFEERGERRAHAFVKALFRGPQGNIPTGDLLEAAGFSPVSPPFPEAIRAWEQADEAAFGARRRPSVELRA
jgi:acyl-CoA thioesterase FadM